VSRRGWGRGQGRGQGGRGEAHANAHQWGKRGRGGQPQRENALVHMRPPLTSDSEYDATLFISTAKGRGTTSMAGQPLRGCPPQSGGAGRVRGACNPPFWEEITAVMVHYAAACRHLVLQRVHDLRGGWGGRGWVGMPAAGACWGEGYTGWRCCGRQPPAPPPPPPPAAAATAHRCGSSHTCRRPPRGERRPPRSQHAAAAQPAAAAALPRLLTTRPFPPLPRPAAAVWLC